MSTLLLRLAAPLQSWGIDAKFDRRGTEKTPTKSGVIGLVAAALGRRRNESLADLSALRFGVRVDREGILLRDYHTARSVKSAYVTQRYYLADAVFLAGLEGDDALLTKIDQAVQNPMFPLFLGRRSCPPDGRLSLGIRRGRTLRDALSEEPWLAGSWQNGHEQPPKIIRMMVDADHDDGSIIFKRDVPISLDQTHRQYGFRRACEICPGTVVHGPVNDLSGKEYQTSHDPMSELED